MTCHSGMYDAPLRGASLSCFQAIDPVQVGILSTNLGSNLNVVSRQYQFRKKLLRSVASGRYIEWVDGTDPALSSTKIPN